MFRKLPKIDVFLLRLVIFDEICSFQRGVKILKNPKKVDFDPLWNEHISPKTTKLNKNWSILGSFMKKKIPE